MSPLNNLEAFEVDPERGFLPTEDPLRLLPTQFEAWEMAAHDLPKLLVTARIRSILNDLPPLDPSPLKTRAEAERAMTILSYLGHAYVWGESQPTGHIPACLAVPWYQVATALGRPPVLSYASYALWNWRRIDPGGPLSLGNIALLQNFLGGLDEEWFILVHIDIEAKAAKAINGIVKVFIAKGNTDLVGIGSALKEIYWALVEMNETMDRMVENCDPYIYYNRVRPYIHGWKDNPALPHGMIYEGVKEYGGKPQSFRGETGAQSSIIPSLDAVLGISHEDDPLREYLNEMRDYMPPRHNEFIKTVEQHGSIRDLIIEHKHDAAELKDIYNSCVSEIHKFRATHLSYAANYINKQDQKSAANPTQVGTGGTPFMTYLAKHRDESKKHLIL